MQLLNTLEPPPVPSGDAAVVKREADLAPTSEPLMLTPLLLKKDKDKEDS